MRDQWSSPEQLRTLQNNRLRKLLLDAVAAPYYRGLLQGSELRTGDPQAVLKSLPILDRAAFMSRPPEAYATRPLAGMFKMSTSGSSGTPLAVYRTAIDEAEFSATWFRVYRAHGCGPFSSEVNIGRNVASAKRGPMRLMREIGVLPPLRIVSSFIPLEEMAQIVATVRPDVLNGYALAIQQLAERQLDEPFLSEPLKMVICAAMEVSPYCMQVAARAFGAPVVNVYVANDGGVLGWSCPADNTVLHTNDDVVLLEVLDERGRELPAGEPGEIVITPLHIRGMPLLRYNLGDIAARVAGPCGCGRSLGLMTPVQGRSSHALRTVSGKQITSAYVAPAITMANAESWVSRYQIRERAVGDLLVSIIARRQPTESESERLKKTYEALLGDEFKIALTLVAELPLAPSGKFQTLVPLANESTTVGGSVS